MIRFNNIINSKDYDFADSESDDSGLKHKNSYGFLHRVMVISSPLNSLYHGLV